MFTKYGWPLNHNGSKTTCNRVNHSSATRHWEAVTSYVVKELGHGCLLGPFVTSPWDTNVAISPLSTRPKHDSQKRHIIMDMSWPIGGASVNSSIDKNIYMN